MPMVVGAVGPYTFFEHRRFLAVVFSVDESYA